jgi:hypothetical protein
MAVALRLPLRPCRWSPGLAASAGGDLRTECTVPRGMQFGLFAGADDCGFVGEDHCLDAVSDA